MYNENYPDWTENNISYGFADIYSRGINSFIRLADQPFYAEELDACYTTDNILPILIADKPIQSNRAVWLKT